MRIDKIIDKITKVIFKPEIIDNILENKVTLKIKLFSLLISFKKILLLIKKWKFKWLQNIEWIEKYNISKESFDSKNKKEWVSAIARLKNWDEFLEKCLLSIINYLDEIILLVDINWTDKTNEICINLSKKYPNKFKYYDYDPIVYPWNHELYSETPDNSVHSLSYFYNYCLSKVNYKYVMKLDDDMLVLDENFKEMVNLVKNKSPNYFLALPQINVSKNEKWDFAIANKFLHSGIAWLFWDHWIFPISNKTYFFNDIWCENLIMPYFIRYWKLSFLHLKNIKSDWWLKNYSGYWAEYVKELLKWTSFKEIPEKYKKHLENI